MRRPTVAIGSPPVARIASVVEVWGLSRKSVATMLSLRLLASLASVGRELPTWSQAQLIVTHGMLTVGIFPSTKPWAPREKERRFLALAEGTIDPSEPPHGGSPLPPLLKSLRSSLEDQGVVILAGEAEGHKLVKLHGGGDDWTVVVGADAWVAVGPKASWPEVVQIGPHMIDSFGAMMRQPDPEPSGGPFPVVHFRVKD
jgi:hypothetical protein